MREITARCPNLSLRNERMRCRWSQQEVADHIGTTPNNVSRWELGITVPGPYFRAKLCDLYGKSVHELGILPEKVRDMDEPWERDGIHTPDVIWTVPYRRNPFFMGREDILQHLREALLTNGVAALNQVQAINGLGGIGKTQTAIEYAYRSLGHYQAVLWARADTFVVLIEDIIALASQLGIPERKDQDQRLIVEAVKCWLKEHRDWLLILDNVEDVRMISTFLPALHSGHLLLTTRNQVLGTLAQGVSIESMTLEEGALFLLRRARRISITASLQEARAWERAYAIEISQMMGGLPLALDQVGAYLEETGCSLSDYRNAYQAQRARLLSLRGSGSTDHPSPVTTTFTLAIDLLEQAIPAANELLRFCAFLHPDAIPKELIIKAASELGPLLEPITNDLFALNELIKNLHRFSLVRCDPDTNTLSIHRLVQVVLKDTLDERRQYYWAERTVAALCKAAPDVTDWPYWQHFLPHAVACADLIEHWQIVSAAAGRLLNLTGVYVVARGQYGQAEPLLVKASQIRLQIWGAIHAESVESLNNLGELHFYQGNFAKAEQLFQQALSIREQLFTPDHPSVAESRSNLAIVFQEQGKYAQAVQILEEVLAFKELHLGPLHVSVAITLSDLAVLYRQQGKYSKALPFSQRALAICEHILGPEQPETVTCLENLGLLLRDQGHVEQAVPLLERVLVIREQMMGSEHPRTLRTFDLLGSLYRQQGKYSKALPFLSRALSLREKVFGPTHMMTASSMHSLALFYLDQEQCDLAEPLLCQAVSLYEQKFQAEHPLIAQGSYDLARLHARQGQFSVAEPLYQRALSIWEKALGGDHPILATCLEHYAKLLHQTQHTRQALACEARANEIQARHSMQSGTGAIEKSDAPLSKSQQFFSFSSFLATCCELKPQACIQASALWGAYRQWAHEQGVLHPLSRRVYAQQLKTYGCTSFRTKTSRLWLGIALRDRQSAGVTLDDVNEAPG